jgi:hypothetical protein
VHELNCVRELDAAVLKLLRLRGAFEWSHIASNVDQSLRNDNAPVVGGNDMAGCSANGQVVCSAFELCVQQTVWLLGGTLMGESESKIRRIGPGTDTKPGSGFVAK